MTAIVARDARASLLTIVTNNSDSIVEGGVMARTLAPSRRSTSPRDYSLFDHVDSGRAASNYSRSSSAKRADLYRKVLYVLAIFCL